MTYRVDTSTFKSHSAEMTRLIKCEDLEELTLLRIPCRRIILRSTMRTPETIMQCGDQTSNDTVLCHECHTNFKNIASGGVVNEIKRPSTTWQKLKDYVSTHPKTALALGLGVVSLVIGGASYAMYQHSATGTASASQGGKPVTTEVPTTQSTTTAQTTTTENATTASTTTESPTTPMATTLSPTTTENATTVAATTESPTTIAVTTESPTTITTTVAATTEEPARSGVNQVKIKFVSHSRQPLNATYEICNDTGNCTTHQHNIDAYAGKAFTFDLKEDFSKMLGTVNFTKEGSDISVTGITKREKDIIWNKHEFISNHTIDSLNQFKSENTTDTLELVHFIVDGKTSKVHLNERFENKDGLPKVAEVTEYYKHMYVHNGWKHLTAHVTVEPEIGGTFTKTKEDWTPASAPFESGIPSGSEAVRITMGSVYGYYTPMRMTGEQINQMRLDNDGKNDLCFTASVNYHSVKDGDAYYAGKAGSTYLAGPSASANKTDCHKTSA